MVKINVYISHKFGGKEENKLEVERILRQLVEKYPRNTFVSPIHCFGYMYDFVDYESGMQMCLDLLDACDYMIVYGDWENSKGCKREIRYAEDNQIPYEIANQDMG